MDVTSISTLIAYNFWANNHILATCERLSTDEFIRDVVPDPGWGSLRGILVHMLDAEYGWRSVLQSQDASAQLEAHDFATVATLKARWDTEQVAWQEYQASLTTEQLYARYGNDPHTGLTGWQIIVHVVNHGTQHRSEAAALLTGYGQSPGDVDFDMFLQQNAGQMQG